MDTWGPRAWKRLHDASLTMDYKRFDVFLNQLDAEMPCPKCQKHFRDYRMKHKLSPRTDLVKWGIDFHNDVNRRIGKRVIPRREAEALVRGEDTTDPVFVGAALALVAVLML